MLIVYVGCQGKLCNTVAATGFGVYRVDEYQV